MNKKYFTVSNSEYLACAIQYITGSRFMKFKDKKDDTKTIYSFPRTKEVMEAYTLVLDAHFKYRK